MVVTMAEPIHIIYLPGFGGKYDNLRMKMLRRWRFRNVTVEMIPIRWKRGTFEQKIAVIDRAIDRANGKRIVLIGESAGGSMAIHMYARRAHDLHKVMTLCGKNTHPETVGKPYFDHSPAFKDSMDQLNQSIKKLSSEQKRRFVAIRPIYDPLIPIETMLLSNCKRVRLPVVGHLFAILMALTIFSPLLVRAAKSK